MNIYMNIWNVLGSLDFYMLLGFLLVFLALLVANYYDLKYGIIPNNLCIFLMASGLLTNIIIFIVLNDTFYMCCYILYVILVFLISFALWKMSFWGGGDLKLFCSMGFSLSFIDILSRFKSHSILNDFTFSSQAMVYPKIFSILVNSILLSFPIIVLYLLYRLYRENKLNMILLAFSNAQLLLKELSTRRVFIGNLKEGMVLENYYFNSPVLLNFMEDTIESNEEDYNLRIGHFGENSYYFRSSSMMGLTREDIRIINFAYRETLINYPNFKIKIGIPFVPSLTVAYLVFLLFGDMIFIIAKMI